LSVDVIQVAFGLVSGSFVGFSLGLVGGGGSILAVPLMIYVVGVPTAHTAIGTSAFAVAVNAAVNLLYHASAGTVKWRCAGVFVAAGISGAFGGSTLSILVDGPKLLAVFAVLMLVVAGFMSCGAQGDVTVQLNRENLPKLLASGFATGALSGFFGIGISRWSPKQPSTTSSATNPSTSVQSSARYSAVARARSFSSARSTTRCGIERPARTVSHENERVATCAVLAFEYIPQRAAACVGAKISGPPIVAWPG
jgi:uncharacterized membrane protein YfcA